MDTKTIGRYALVAGVVLALLNAFDVSVGDFGPTLLALLGLAGGILYLSTDDATGFYILTAAVATLGASLGMGDDFFTVGEFVTTWMAGSAAVLGAAAVALIVRTFYSWVMP